MKRKWNLAIRFLCLVMVCCISCRISAQKKEIIGYYPSWKWKSMGPSKIPYDKLTYINYAFFHPSTDGSLVGRDTVGDVMILLGEWDSAKRERKPHTSLTHLAHRNRVKVMLSIGGWADSDNFPEIARHKHSRARFANSCIDQIQRYGFDGIDIDWEYPGYADHKGTADDRKNFTTLLAVVRDSLRIYGNRVGRKFLLTAALPAFEAALAHYEMDSIVTLLDQLNIMTYDFNGPWSPLSGHNSPLYAPRADDSLANVDAAFKLFTRKYRVPAAKLNLGVPFYGQTFAGTTSLYSPHAGPDTVNFSKQGAFYYDIARLKDECTRVWDSAAKVPYLVCKSWNALVSYDDEKSVAYKARYVLDNNASGLIIWEITGDLLPDGRTPLLDVIYSTFKSSTSR